MVNLNELQIIIISKELEKVGLEEGILKNELLDHTCCAVENELMQGVTFPEALKRAIDSYDNDEIKEVQEETKNIHNYKYNLMKKITWLGSSIAATALLISVFTHAQNTPNINPIDGEAKITSGFGMRVHPILKERVMHEGMDLRAAMGTPVKATADGVVIEIQDQNDGYGKMIILKHDKEFKTRYSQLSDFNVDLGDRVKSGDLIGYVGSSGASTGPHLHYEVIKNEEKVDPLVYMNHK